MCCRIFWKLFSNGPTYRKNIWAFSVPTWKSKLASEHIWVHVLLTSADNNINYQNNCTKLCVQETETLCNHPCWVFLWWPGNGVKMLTLEYLVIISGIFFSLAFLWLLTVVGALDCLRNSPIKSASHCLSLIIGQSEQVLTNTRAKLRQRNTSHPAPLHSISVSNPLVPYTV